MIEHESDIIGSHTTLEFNICIFMQPVNKVSDISLQFYDTLINIICKRDTFSISKKIEIVLSG